jgi:hypothetical protein
VEDEVTWTANGAYNGHEWVIKLGDKGPPELNDVAQQMLSDKFIPTLDSDVSMPPLYYYQSKGENDPIAIVLNVSNLEGLVRITGDLPDLKQFSIYDDVSGPGTAYPSVPGSKLAAIGTKVLPMVTQAGGDHSGGMVALIPSAESANLLQIPGGDPADELHVTLMYLGDDASVFTEAQRDILRAVIASVARKQFGTIEATIPGVGTLGPTATVYFIGDSERLQYLYEDVRQAASIVGPFVPVPPDRKPWIPHLTARMAEGGNVADLTYRGPVVFDRLRIVFGGATMDIPFVTEETYSMPPTIEPMMPEDKTLARDFLMAQDHDIALDAKDAPDHASTNVHAAKLREYWTRGPGAAKIRWGTPGDFKRAVSHLRKFVGARAEGLAAVYHHVALGVWPGREKAIALDQWTTGPLNQYKTMVQTDTITSTPDTEEK